MAFGAQPQQSQSSGPSAEQMAISQMGQFAQQPNSLAGILSNLNALTAPTMNPNGPGSTNVLVSMPQAQQTSAAAHGGGTGPTGSSGGTSNPLNGVSSQQISQLGKTLSSLLGTPSVPTGMAGTALGGAGLPSGLTAAQQANLSSAFSAPAVSGSLADAIGLTAGSLAPLTAAELAPVGTGAVTAAGNMAAASAASELSGALGTPAAASAPAAAASAPAASSAGGMGAGALAADAGALSALGWMGYNATHGPANNGWSMQAMQNLTNNVRANTASGLISPSVNGLTAPAGVNYMNPNGTVNTNLTSAVQGLQQMQLGDFGPMTNTMQNQLNSMGYQGIKQAASGKQLGAAGGTVSPAAALLRKRF